MGPDVLRDRRRHHAGRDDRGRNQDPRAFAAAKAVRKWSLAEDEGCCDDPIADGPNTQSSCTGIKRTVSGEGRSSGSDMSTTRRKPSGRSAPQFVVCIKNAGYQHRWSSTRSTGLFPTPGRYGTVMFESSTRAARTTSIRPNGLPPLSYLGVSEPLSSVGRRSCSPQDSAVELTRFARRSPRRRADE